MGRGPFLGTVVLAAALAAGCGGTASAPTPSTVRSETASPTPTSNPTSMPAAVPTPKKAERPVAVPKTLMFTATTLDGKAYDGAQLAGKPTALWFWAPWCHICRGEAPTVKDLAAKHKDAINLVGVGGLGETNAMNQFVADEQLDDLPQLADEEGKVWKHFDVTSQSYWVLLDENGDEIDRGRMDHDELTTAIDELAK